MELLPLFGEIEEVVAGVFGVCRFFRTGREGIAVFLGWRAGIDLVGGGIVAVAVAAAVDAARAALFSNSLRAACASLRLRSACFNRSIFIFKSSLAEALAASCAERRRYKNQLSGLV